MIQIILLLLFSIGLIKKVLKHSKYYFFCYILPYFMFAWKALSLTYLEGGVYSPEIATNTTRIYSDYMFLFQMMVFWLVLFYFIKILNMGIEIKDTKGNDVAIRKIYGWIRWVHCAVICYLYLNLALSGSTFGGTYDRFTYFSASKLPFISMFSGTLSYFFLFIDGALLFFGKRYRKFSLVLFAMCVVYQIAIGNKFSGIYQYTFFFFAPYFLLKAREKRKLRFKEIFTAKTIFLGCFGAALLLIVLYIGYREQISQGARFIELLSSRILNMQAGTLWGISNYINESKFALWGNPKQLSIELEGILNGYGELDTRIGLGKVMSLVCPSYVVTAYLSNGIRLSGWYLAVTYVSMGYIGSALFSGFLAFVFAVFCVALVTAAREKNVVMIALSLYGYYQIYEFYRIGNFTILFNMGNIMLFVVILTYVWAARHGMRFVLGKNKHKNIKIRG